MSSPPTLIGSAAAEDPAQGLRAVVALRKLADQLEAVQVANARSLGRSWQDIAEHLGVSRQAVHKKYGK